MGGVILTRSPADRRGGDCRRQGAGLVNQSLRTGIVPEDADMGTHECDSWVPVPSKYLDPARWVPFVSWTHQPTADDDVYGPAGAAAFIASAAKHLPPSDVWCILYPSLEHFLRSDVRDVDDKSLLLAMKRRVWFTATRIVRVLHPSDSTVASSLRNFPGRSSMPQSSGP